MEGEFEIMTLDDLLLISADEWDKLSLEELTKILEPYFSVTRPPDKTTPKGKQIETMNKKRDMKKDLSALEAKLKKLGFDV